MGFLDLFDVTVVNLARLVTYSILVFFSFFIFVGVAVMKKEAYGNCPLYADGKAGFGPVSDCNYPMVIAILFQLLYTLYRIVLILLIKCGMQLGPFSTHFKLVDLVHWGVDALGLLTTFISACILSAGHNYTCDRIGKVCGDRPWVHSSRSAQAGAWLGTCFWLFLVLIGFLHIWREGGILCFKRAPTPSADAKTKDEEVPPPLSTISLENPYEDL
ncbi:unnamed protein product [Lymnaea stagnalis]|uniref:MARVEL domain-containing protein n=1 Tax=Lymnaea stagnalis TaxID=6523 RepID=A0AAV2IKC9_LYMST